MCSYRDRRGNACTMAFCPDHWSEVGGVVYCRRHAGTISAMGSDLEVGALPELENRGPSLVSWVADEIGPDVEELLRAAARSGETVRTNSGVKVVFDHKRRRRWERSWKLIEPTGISVKVALTVNEDEDDALIDVRVNSNVIARGVPSGSRGAAPASASAARWTGSSASSSIASSSTTSPPRSPRSAPPTPASARERRGTATSSGTPELGGVSSATCKSPALTITRGSRPPRWRSDDVEQRRPSAARRSRRSSRTAEGERDGRPPRRGWRGAPECPGHRRCMT